MGLFGRSPLASVLNSKPNRWKGKKRDDSSGGASGSIVSLQLVGDGVYNAAYTIPVVVGNSSQQFSLQVDTGSSDLWIASTSCSSTACTSGKPRLYDPSSSSIATGQSVDITYLSGEADGPIVWDKFIVGGYEINNQAMVAADNVVNETLSPDYSGILGLALPLNSEISQVIPPVTNNSPDGATFASNLFGITPVNQAPSQFFYSLLLERPGSSAIPSVLGIGQHPSSIVPDPSKVLYSTTISEEQGAMFWKVELRALTVYVNGTKMDVDIGNSVSGNVFPEAILDSGVPYIIATPWLANGIWGALGIGPASDGNYYVPCTTPLNMTVTLDDRPEIPLHPLDLSAISQTDPSNNMCIGLVQQDSVLANAESVADIILGVPFLRNVYTVMAYEEVNATGFIGNGSIESGSDDSTGLDDGGENRGPEGGFQQNAPVGPSRTQLFRRAEIKPQLGLLNLTNPSTAISEFNTVRVMNQPLEQGHTSTPTPAPSDGKKLSVGLDVLFGLAGLFVLCAVMFVTRWLIARKRLNMDLLAAENGREGFSDDGKNNYILADYKHFSPTRSLSHVPSEDTQQTLATQIGVHFKGEEKPGSMASQASGSARSVREELGDNDDELVLDEEVGLNFRRPKKGREQQANRDWDCNTAWIDSYSSDQPPLHGEWRPSDEPLAHERSLSTFSSTSGKIPLLDSLHGRGVYGIRDEAADFVTAGLVNSNERGRLQNAVPLGISRSLSPAERGVSRPRSARMKSLPRSQALDADNYENRENIFLSPRYSDDSQ